MNEKKILFAICGNDKFQLEECQYYIEQLFIPEEMKIEVKIIPDAVSMTQGYNRAMKESDAKYKIYLHQDVRIIYREMLVDMMDTFFTHSEVGIMGVIGREMIPAEGLLCDNWEYGEVAVSMAPFALEGSKESTQGGYCQMLDGLILMTQYDIIWREDLFTGWDFYDASQCMEFIRAGYQVMVPEQKSKWCWHDNEASQFRNYDKYRQIFAEEYTDLVSIDKSYHQPFNLELDRTLQELKACLTNLIKMGQWNMVSEIYEQYGKMMWSDPILCKIHNIAQICQLEKKASGYSDFCGDETDLYRLIDKMDRVKNWLKRIEYDIPTGTLSFSVSKEALQILMICYVKEKDKVKAVVLK